MAFKTDTLTGVQVISIFLVLLELWGLPLFLDHSSVRGGADQAQKWGNLLSLFFSVPCTEHMTFSGVVPYWLCTLTFSSLMMHDCDPVNMTGGVRSDSPSSHPLLCLHYSLELTYWAALMLVTQHRSLCCDWYHDSSKRPSLSPLCPLKPCLWGFLKPRVGFINGLSCLWHHN